MNCSLFFYLPGCGDHRSPLRVLFTIFACHSEPHEESLIRLSRFFAAFRMTMCGDRRSPLRAVLCGLFLLDLVELCVDFKKIFLGEDTLYHGCGSLD